MVAAAACYSTWTTASDRHWIASLVSQLPTSRQQSAAQQVVWTALSRGDVETVHFGLRIFRRGGADWALLVSWLLGHRLEDRSWLKIEILGALVEDEMDSASAMAIYEPIQSLLSQALDQDDYETSYQVIDRSLRALTAAEPFTNEHANVMCEVGRVLWLTGDYRGEAPRTARIPAQLEWLQMIYRIRRKDIWFALLHRGDIAGVEQFVALLCITIQDTGQAASDFSLVYDIIVDGIQGQVLSE